MKKDLWWNRASACWMAVVGIVLTILVTKVSPTANKLDMTKFAKLVEEKTCNDHLGDQWHSFVSMYVFDENFRWFVDWKKANEEPFEGRIRTDYEIKNKREYPIFHIDIDRHYDFHRYFEKESETIQKQRNKSSALFFYPLDDIKILYIFKQNKKNDTYLVYYINGVKQKQSKTNEQPGGFIPLVHTAKETSFESKTPITFISNRDYSYCSGYLQIDPIELKFEHTYYYGFDVDLNTVYFGEKLSHLEKHVVNYVPASALLADSGWHPFLCYQYVYIVTEQWVLVFPYVRLHVQLQLLNNPAILKAKMELIHINTFFRCTSDVSTVPFPTYPSREIIVHLQTSDTIINSTNVWIPLLILVMLIIVSILLYWVFIKKRMFCKSGMSSFKLKVNKSNLAVTDTPSKNNKPQNNHDKKSKMTTPLTTGGLKSSTSTSVRSISGEDNNHSLVTTTTTNSRPNKNKAKHTKKTPQTKNKK